MVIVSGSIGTAGDPAQRLAEIGFELGERLFDTARSTDEDKIGTGDSGFGKNDPGKLSEASPHPVADHGVTDLLRDGEAEAKGRVAIVARTDEQDETGRGRTPTAVRGQEVRAAGELDDRGRC